MTALNPQIIGQAENAHRALLVRSLASKDISYEAWVALAVVFAAGSVDREELIHRLTGALKTEPAVALDAIERLTSTHLLETSSERSSKVMVTGAGQALISETRAAIDPVIARVYGGFAADDLATAGQVLTEITARLAKALQSP